MTDTISFGPGPVARQIVTEGDGDTLIINQGPSTVFFGGNNSIRATDAGGIVPITANSYFAVNGKSDLYACVASGTTANLDIISGGLNFFLPLVSLTIPYGSTGARIVINPPDDPGAIVGYDGAGNVTFVIDSTGLLVGPSTGPQVEISGGNPAAVTFPLNDSAFAAGNPSVFGQVSGSGAARYAAMILQSPTTILSAHDDYMEVDLNSPNADGSSTANFSIAYHDASGTSRAYFIEDYTGIIIQACSVLQSTQPGTGTSYANPAVPESWHSMTLTAGWSGLIRIKYLAESNFAVVECSASHAGASGSVTLVTSVPAGYAPAANRTFPIGIIASGAPANASWRGAVNASGSITIGSLPAGTTFIGFTAIYSLD